MAAGQEDQTIIVGTKVKLTANMKITSNQEYIYKKMRASRRKIPGDHQGRFEDAFVQEAGDFAACCSHDGRLPMRFQGAVQALILGVAFPENFGEGKGRFEQG